MQRWRASELLGAAKDGHFRRIVVQEERLRSGTLSFAPGDTVPKHAHVKSDEIFFGVSGVGTIIIEDETYELGPGDLIFTRAGEPHALRVTESAIEPFVVFAVVAPNSGDDTVFFE